MTDYRQQLEARFSVEQVRRTFEGVSFSPEKRAHDAVNEAVEWLNHWMPQLEDDTERERVFNRFAHLWIALQQARGRTISPMIVGPARFPVDRNRKAMATEDKRRTEYLDFSASVEARIAKRDAPPSSVITSDDPQALDKLREKLAAIEAEADNMVRWNKQFAKGGVDAMDCGDTLKQSVRDLMARCEYLKVPFIASNRRAEARRIKGRIEQLERQASATTIEKTVGDVRIVADPEANRVRIYFPGKPDADKRMALKRSGFRWAPSEGAWQRFYSASAFHAAQAIAA